jgi:two-component system response regulator PilR (NtrC family)
VARYEAVGHLLVVDDEPDVATAIAEYFQRHGYDVDTAGRVSDAKAFLSTNRYDVLITDVDLPDGSGFELLALQPRWSGCRSVAISGKLDPKTTARAMAMGASATLAKPLSLCALELVLSSAADTAVA